MINLRQQASEYLNAGATNDTIGLHSWFDDEIFLTKDQQLGAVIACPGIDFEGKDPAALDSVCRRFEAAVRTFTDEHRIYQYLIKTAAPLLQAGSHPNEFVAQATANRLDFFRAKADKLFKLDIFFVITIATRTKTTWLERFKNEPAATLKASLSSEHCFQIAKTDLERLRNALYNTVQTFIIATEDLFHAHLLNKQDGFQFFRRLLNFDPNNFRHARLPEDDLLDFHSCAATIEAWRRHLRHDDYFVEVLTLKQPPASTFANVLAELFTVPSEFIVCSEFRRIGNDLAARLIQSKRRHFHNSKTSIIGSAMAGEGANQPGAVLVNSASSALVAELGECQTEIEVKNNYFAEFSLTLVLYNRSQHALAAAIAEVYKIFHTKDADLFRETYNLLNAYMGIVPGNSMYNIRRMYLTGVNYADLAFIFTIKTGDPVNRHLNAEYLALFETDHQSLYYFNLHYNDVAHTLILGATGSGKSFLLNFLITNLQKYNGFTCIFDLGGSYKRLTNLFGGTYSKVSVEKRAFEINPFSLPLTPDNHEFIFSFMRVLLESDGAPAITVPESKEVYAAIKNLYRVPDHQRRLATISGILPKALEQRLARWVEGGQYGMLFDNQQDTLTFADFQCFDFEGLDKYPVILEPLLFYILHRANQIIYDPTQAAIFKTFVMDEAWRFFANATIRDYLREALKTWRKRNAAMILATQSGDDLRNSDILPLILESCPTRLFLANPGMNPATYCEHFKLNQTEAEQIQKLAPKRQMLLHTPDITRILNLEVDSRSYWLFTNSPNDNARCDDLIRTHGLTRALDILSSAKPGQA